MPSSPNTYPTKLISLPTILLGSSVAPSSNPSLRQQPLFDIPEFYRTDHPTEPHIHALARHIYTAVVRPAISYGASIWRNLRLQEFLSHLESLYMYMFKNVDSRYLEEGSQKFQIMRGGYNFWTHMEVAPFVELRICALTLSLHLRTVKTWLLTLPAS